MEHGDGLPAQSHDLHYLDQPAGACVCARGFVCGMGGLLCVRIYCPQRAGREDFRPSKYSAGRGDGRGDRYIFGHPHCGAAFFTRPFYDPASWNTKEVLGGTSVAVLTYIGFDGISTLSEEAENPRRNIMLATVLTCLAVGILSASEVYVAQLVWPASQPFPNQDTAYVYAAARTWAPLFTILGATLLVANFGSGMGAQIGAARLLYGMGK